MLKIQLWIADTEKDILNFDYTLLPELRAVRHFDDEGRKAETKYCDKYGVVVLVEYSDIVKDNELVGIKKVISWLNQKGEIELEKTMIKDLDSFEAFTELENRKKRKLWTN